MSGFSLLTTDGRPRHVLVVAAAADLGDRLVTVLATGGLDVVRVATPAEAVEHLDATPTSLVLVVDESLGEDGALVCARLRRHGYRGGVVLLGEAVDEDSVVRALELGADDHVPRAGPVAELLSRVRAVLRRVDRTAGPGPVEGTGLHVDGSGAVITCDGEIVVGTGRERDLLELLIARRGRVVARDELVDAVWGPGWTGSPRVLDAAVRRVRERLADAGVPEVVENVRGVGFRLSRTGA